MENPMISEDILQRFFEVCDLSDLTRFRLVSSQWRDLSLRRWRKEKYMHIYQSMPFKMTRRDEERVTSVCTPPILDKPYKSFVLQEISLSDETFSWIPIPTKLRRNNKKELPLMERFWNVCGASMTRLRLYNCAVHSVQVFRKVIFLPNLEELSLEGIYVHENCRQISDGCEMMKPIEEQSHLKILAVSRVEDWECLQLSWQLLLSAFPNVQTLRLSCSFEHIEALTEALEDKKQDSINSLELDLRWPKMKGLKFTEVPAFPPLENIIFRMMDDKEIWSLRKLVQHPTLKLKSFILVVSDITQVTNLLVNLALECHGSSLKSVILNRGYSNLIPLSSGFNLNTIPLTNLTELVFIGDFYETLGLFGETPNLNILRVSQVSEGEKILTESCVEEIRRNSVRLSLLEVFKFDWTKSPNSQVSREWMAIFVELMPNVKELKAPLSPEAFQIVCEKWRELRCLKITSVSMDDGTLTGIVAGREERLPNITDLKYLQVLKINGEKLTDVAVWNGLLHISLHTLTVTLSHETSNEAFLELFNRFSGGKVSRAWIPHSVPEKTRKMKKQLNKELWKKWSSRSVVMYTSQSPTLFNNDCQVY